MPRLYPATKKASAKPTICMNWNTSIALPSFLSDFLKGFLYIRRVTVPPERANRLPCMVAFPNYSTVISTVPLFCVLYLF